MSKNQYCKTQLCWSFYKRRKEEYNRGKRRGGSFMHALHLCFMLLTSAYLPVATKTRIYGGFESYPTFDHFWKRVEAVYDINTQKYSRLRCLLRVKGLVICFYLGSPGSSLQFSQIMIKLVSKSWLVTCSSNSALSLPSYTGSALKRAIFVCCIFDTTYYFFSKS